MQKSNYKCNSYQTLSVETTKTVRVRCLGLSILAGRYSDFLTPFLSYFIMNLWGGNRKYLTRV